MIELNITLIKPLTLLVLKSFVMNAIDLKTELKQLIDSEQDLSILQSFATLLRKTRMDKTLKRKLTERALNSEEDIRSGNVYSREDFEKRLNTGI